MSSMTFGDVRVETRDHVAIAEMRRPPHNFFDTALIRDLANALEAVDRLREHRAVVLAAEGKSFCAGHNFKSSQSADAKREPREVLYKEAERLIECSTPVIAAIQGAAIGGGLGLAMVADFRVCTTDAIFSAPFVRLGVSPGFGLTYTLPRLIGEQRAALLAYTGRRIDGSQAYEWGLVDKVAAADGLREAAMELAIEIAEAAPLAVVATRQLLRREFAEGFREATAREAAKQQCLSQTRDCAEGARASMERRTPIFTGQ